MALPLEQMEKDAANVQAALDRGVEHFVGPASEQVGDLCCHVQALVCEVNDLESQLRMANEAIRDIAWHVWDGASANWSGPDILAHTADYFDITVKELEDQMERAR